MEWVRTFLGVDGCSDGRSVTCVCLSARGRALEARAEIAGVARREIPDSVRETLARISADAPIPPRELAALSGELAALQADAAREAWSTARSVLGGDAASPLVLGARGPMIWPVDSESCSVTEVADPALLAERTEFNVVDAFSARDVARGGAGGPLDALAEWMLLRDVKRNRVLLDLGETTCISFLPGGCETSVTSGVSATELTLGQKFLNSLASRMIGPECSPKKRIDLATRGRCDDRLLEHIASTLKTSGGHETRRSGGESRVQETILGETVQFAERNAITTGDVLCTATHSIAAAICDGLEQCVPPSPTRIQMAPVGAGALDGLLLREVSRRAPPFDAFELPGGMRDEFELRASCVALLALLHVDQTPQTMTRTTQIEAPRVLGRLTPGSPGNWRRLLTAMAESAPERMSLRCAI